MSSEIFAVKVTATGTAINRRCRIKSIQFLTSGAGAGSIIIREGGAGGTIKIDIDTLSTADSQSVYIPDDGVLFNSNAHVTLTNISSVTIFYG